jgi:hypothetical protein
VGEILIVVVGILLAFGVDALWQGIQDRRIGGEVAAGIAESVERNRAELVVQYTRREAKLAATRELLGIVVDSRSEASPDSVAALLRTLRSYQDFDSDDSRLRELLASGRMHLIRSADLRVLLAGWERTYEDLRGVEDKAYEHSTQQVDRWLVSRVPVTGGPGRYDQVPPRPLTASDLQVLRDLEFENLLRQQYFWDQLAVGRARSVLDLFDEMLRLLADELGVSPTAS